MRRNCSQLSRISHKQASPQLCAAHETGQVSRLLPSNCLGESRFRISRTAAFTAKFYSQTQTAGREHCLLVLQSRMRYEAHPNWRHADYVAQGLLQSQSINVTRAAKAWLTILRPSCPIVVWFLLVIDFGSLSSLIEGWINLEEQKGKRSLHDHCHRTIRRFRRSMCRAARHRLYWWHSGSGWQLFDSVEDMTISGCCHTKIATP